LPETGVPRHIGTGGCELDPNRYPKGIVVTAEEIETIKIKPAKFHGEWNYTIFPNNRADRAVDS
jgi:hypothetical protein